MAESKGMKRRGSIHGSTVRLCPALCGTKSKDKLTTPSETEGSKDRARRVACPMDPVEI